MSTESLVNKEAFAPEEPEDFGERWRTGVVLLIVADASFVVALSFAFLYLRGINTQASFHPGGTGVASLWWPWVVTRRDDRRPSWPTASGSRCTSPDAGTSSTLGVAALVGMAVALVLTLVEMYRFPLPRQRQRLLLGRCGCSRPATSSTC